MPSSSTKTSPCSIGFRVPASMFKYGSAFIVVTLKPRDLRRRAIEEVAMPLPIPDMTPPDTKTTLVFAIKKPSLLILAGGALPCPVPDGTGHGPRLFSQRMRLMSLTRGLSRERRHY